MPLTVTLAIYALVAEACCGPTQLALPAPVAALDPCEHCRTRFNGSCVEISFDNDCALENDGDPDPCDTCAATQHAPCDQVMAELRCLIGRC